MENTGSVRKRTQYFALFTYRDNKIIFQEVISKSMLDEELVQDYSKRFKNGTLLE